MAQISEAEMKGIMLIYEPGKQEGLLKPINTPPEVDVLRGILSGPLELVPCFDKVAYCGKLQKCVAYCNEDGKGNRLRFNIAATMAWEQSLNSQGKSLKDGMEMVDYLVGPIVVLFGDKEFMEAL
jgi:hypothetical protein